MFEDIDDVMRRGKNSAGKDDDETPSHRNFGSRGRGGPSEDDIAKVLRKAFGGEVHAVPGGILMEKPGGGAHKEIYEKLSGLVDSLSYMAEKMGITPHCVDTNKQELVVGDVLKCPGGENKTVLKVGWKFVVLSRTDDQTKADGTWFEEEMNLLNFIKKV